MPGTKPDWSTEGRASPCISRAAALQRHLRTRSQVRLALHRLPRWPPAAACASFMCRAPGLRAMHRGFALGGGFARSARVRAAGMHVCAFGCGC